MKKINYRVISEPGLVKTAYGALDSKDTINAVVA